MGSKKPGVGRGKLGKTPPPDLALLLQRAIEHHTAGRLMDAAAHYQEILLQQPKHADALRLLGMVAYQCGEIERAADLLGQAVESSPNSSVFHSDLGLALESLGRLDEAISSYGRAIALQPDYAIAHYNLGNALKKRGRLTEAVASYDRAIVLQPDHAPAYNNRGSVLLELGLTEEAVSSHRRAIVLKPDFAEAYFNLGNALRKSGRLEEALAQYSQAIAIDAQYAAAYQNRGHVFCELDRYEEGTENFRRAIAIKPDDPEAHYDLGTGLQRLGHIEEAIASFQHAVTLRPDYVDALNNLGMSLTEKGSFDEALPYLQQALAIQPDHIETLSNLGSAYRERGQNAEAIAYHLRAVSRQPDLAELHWNLASSLLLSGDLSKGWEEYDWRWKGRATNVSTLPKKQEFPQAWWNGEDLSGKTILVWGEQGIGDEMLFANVLPDVIAAARHCVVQCAPRLVSLFARSFPQAEIVPCLDPHHPRTLAPDIDLQSAMGSLPRWFRKTVESFPKRPGYLIPDPERVQYWKQRLEALGDKPKIGICWRSMLKGVKRNLHYTRLSQWGDILRLPGVTFINLQYDDCQAELEAARKEFGIEIHDMEGIDLLNDLDDAAALTAALDLVMAPSTSVTAMAGAIGKAAWLFTLDDSWTSLGTDHLPWFPGMKVYKRKWNEAWEGVFAEMARALTTTFGDATCPDKTETPAKDPLLEETLAKAMNAAIDYHQSGQFSQAEALYAQILKVQPDNPDVLHLLGVMAHQLGDSQAAIDLIGRAIAIDAKVSAFHNNLGNVLKSQDRLDEAIASYERSLALDGNSSDAHNNLGEALTSKARYAEAERHLKRAIALNPKLAEAHNNLGNLAREQNKLKEAIAHYRRAIAINPSYAGAHNNLGSVLQSQGDLDDAVASFECAIAVNPKLAEAYNNLGLALRAQGKVGEAITPYRQAIVLRPDFVDAHWNLSFSLLYSGDLSKGWEEYDWRWKGRATNVSTLPKKQEFPQAWWHGEDLSGKTILVWGEQGIGDEMLFANVLPDVIAAARHCVVQCAPRLVSLFARSFPQAEIVPCLDPHHPRTLAPDIDLQSAMGSLPRWFRKTVESFPKRPGYLIPDPERVQYWKQRLEALGDKPKIGICWRSMLKGVKRDPHYTQLMQWGDILSVPGVTFINLQYDDCQAELEAARKEFGIEIHDMEGIDLLNDLDDAAALTAALDLVIAPSTSVVAMAGAIGKAAWLFTPDDNWTMLGTVFEPWFSGMKVFTRTWNEPWERVLGEMTQELEKIFGDATCLDKTETPAKDPLLEETLAKAMNAAIEYHQSGQFSQAEALYAQILKVQPDNPDVLHLLGVMAHQLGDSQAAIDLIGRAIAIDARVSAFHNNLGNVLKSQDRLDEAIASYERSLALDGNSSDAHSNLGEALTSKARYAEAERHLKRAIAINPKLSEAHNNLGNLAKAQNKLKEAVAHYRRAIAISPNYAGAYNNLGSVLQSQGDLDGAVASFRRAIAINPRLAEAYNNLGLALRSQNKNADASWNFEQAIALNPRFVDAYINLSSNYLDENRYTEVIDLCNKAQTIAPDRSEIYVNSGVAFQRLGKPEQAIEFYGKALSLNPEDAKTHWNYSVVLLTSGNLARGWEEYDWRWKREESAFAKHDFPQAWWGGEDLKGKTILVWGEQGVGDEILFANALPDAITAARRCVVQCSPRLVSLFARSFPQAEIVPSLDPHHPRTLAADIDLQIAMGSLPRWFRPTIASFPKQAGYLVPDAERVAYWKKRLDALGDRPKIGICWRSMLRNATRDLYYTQLTQWGPILATPGVVFINLQYDDCQAELEAARRAFGIEIHDLQGIDLLNDLDDAAALTAALDLVISPATSVAAMAGALGIPVWEISPLDNWPTLGSDHMPWFPSIEVFPRKWEQPWEEVLAEIAQRLRSLTPVSPHSG